MAEKTIEERVTELEGRLGDRLAPQLATKADLDAAVNRLDAKIDLTTARMEARIERVEQKFDAKFVLLQWMLGFNLLLTAGVLWRLLR
jgi:uncharacterized coiled-coil protein SlyX